MANTLSLLAALVTVLTFATPIAEAAVPITASNVLFGTAIKNGPLPPATELTTFEHNCTQAPCTITQIHIPSIYPSPTDKFDWENGRVRIYIDGSSIPSIDVTILELAHVGKRGAVSTNTPADGSPYGIDLFGKTAKSGGVYTTMRIPFQTSIRTTIQAPDSYTGQSIFWFVIRGVEGLPIQLGHELVLPDQASIAMYRNADVTLQPEEFITVAAAASNQAGALISLMFDAQSGDYNFLEACVRFYPNGQQNPIFLSSGTEDFFLSASYYDEGMFKTSQSGVTYIDGAGSVAMYKIHDSRDYIVWNAGMNMTWRDMENSCPTAWPWPSSSSSSSASFSSNVGEGVGPVNVSTIVFMYTWPSDASQLTFSGVPASAYNKGTADSMSSSSPSGSSLTASLQIVKSLQAASLITQSQENTIVDGLLHGDVRFSALITAYADDAKTLARHITRLL